MVVSMVVPLVLICLVVGIIYLIVVLTHQVPSDKTKKENIFNTLQKAQKKTPAPKKKDAKKQQNKKKQEKKEKKDSKKKQPAPKKPVVKKEAPKKQEKKEQKKQEKKKEKKAEKKQEKKQEKKAEAQKKKELYAQIAAKPAEPKPVKKKKKKTPSPVQRPHGQETASKYNPDDFSGFTEVKKKKYQKPREQKRDNSQSNSYRNGSSSSKSYRHRNTNGNANASTSAAKSATSSLFVTNAYSTEDDFWSGNVTQPSEVEIKPQEQSPSLQAKPKVVIKMFQPVATTVPNPWKKSSADTQEPEQESSDETPSVDIGEFPSL